MKKWYFIPLCILLATVFILSGCGGSTTTAPAVQATASAAQAPAPAATSAAPAKPAETVIIKYGHDMPPNVAPPTGLNWWAEEVTKRTDGRVKVEMYPASSLVPQSSSVDAVRSGVADMYFLSITSWRKQFPLSSIVGMPGLGFPDDSEEANVNHVNTFMEYMKKYPKVAEEYKDFVPVFFYVIYSESYLLSKDKKVLVPDDIKGLKVGSNGIRAEFVNKLGAVSVTDVPPTSYEKLQTGVTNACFAAISAVHDFKIYEVTKYLPDVVFGAGGHPQIINKNTWEKISPEDQKIMMDLAPEASRISSKNIGDLNALSWKEVVDKGMVLETTPEQKAEWNKVFEPLWEDWIKENEANGHAEAREMLNWWKSKVDAAWAAR
ncbi:MAG: TRAP transporter substrate-binding protein DctP [Dehalococcoidales bacterium]|nr:TRAP transporter substrate-binding protein DctP [Dehalococcoidales bacterium]